MSKSKALTRRNFLRLAGLGWPARRSPHARRLRLPAPPHTDHRRESCRKSLYRRRREGGRSREGRCRDVVVQEAAPVAINGTLWVIQKKDFFPEFNDGGAPSAGVLQGEGCPLM